MCWRRLKLPIESAKIGAFGDQQLGNGQIAVRGVQQRLLGSHGRAGVHIHSTGQQLTYLGQPALLDGLENVQRWPWAERVCQAHQAGEWPPGIGPVLWRGLAVFVLRIDVHAK